MIVSAFSYETEEEGRKVGIDCLLQINKPVKGVKKLYFKEADALKIFEGVIDLDKPGLGLIQKTLLIQESYALQKAKSEAEDEGELPF